MGQYISKSALVAEIEKRVNFNKACCAYSRADECNAILSLINNLEVKEVEEPVSELWHDASEEPNDMSHCLIFYGCKESVGHYLHYEPVLYNKKEKMFVTASFPHPTGYKVEQKSIDGGCVAEVYKNKRDRISISDITQWCYLKDLHNLSNVQRTVKNWKEEPVSEDLEEAAFDYAEACKYEGGEKLLCVEHFKAGAQWKEKKDKQHISDDLSEEIDYLSKRYPEVCFAKLTRIAVHVAKWQRRKLLQNSIEVDVESDKDGLYTTETWDEMNTLLQKIGAKEGEKVYISIIKQEEE